MKDQFLRETMDDIKESRQLMAKLRIMLDNDTRDLGEYREVIEYVERLCLDRAELIESKLY